MLHYGKEEISQNEVLPEEEPNFGFSLEDEDAGRSEPERVLGAVLPEDNVHVYAVHLELLGLVQKLELGLRWCQAPENRFHSELILGSETR
jgi:hypothetical protein